MTLILATFGLLGVSSHAQDRACTGTAAFSERVEFADLARAQRILRHRDPWAKQLSSFDRGARQKTIEPTSLSDFLTFAADQGRAWTAAEQDGWKSVVDKLSNALSGLNLHLPNIDLVKTSGSEEFNAAYTRARAIMLPASMASLPATSNRRAFFLLAHELFHVLSREDSTLQDELYALLGFKLLPGFEYPAELEPTRGSNPDAFDYLHALTVQSGPERIDVVPLIQTSRSLAEVIRSNFFEALEIVLLAVDTSTGKAMRNDSGELRKYSFSNTNWVPLMQRNSSYIIHPEELLADNFATLMEWRSEGALPPRNPGGDPANDVNLLTAIRDVLERGCVP